MNPIDSTIIAFANGYAHRSELFDVFIQNIADNGLLKGGVIMAMIWSLWFRYNDQSRQDEQRELIIATILGALIAVLIVRIMEYVLPFRVMPMFSSTIAFKVPYGFTPSELDEMRRVNTTHNSSFPSDHAGLFFALATGIFLTHRLLGIITFAYTLIVISLPRIYIGRHYPSDILAGGLIGIGIVYIMSLPPLKKRIAHPIFVWHQKSPAVFYAIFFLLSYEIAFLFADVRALARLLRSVLEGWL